MARIEQLQPPFPEALQAQWDRIMRGKLPLSLFRTLATSDRAWKKFTAGSLLDRGPLTLRQREIVIDRTCARSGCEYEWGVHVATFAEAAGLTRGEVRALCAVPFEAAGWRDEESALIATIDALHERSRLTDDEFARLRVHFNEAGILEVLMLAGFYKTVSYLANGLDLPLEADGARFADYADD